MLKASQRKVLNKIYEPVLDNGQWRNRYNHEIYNLCKEMELTKIEKTPVGGSCDEDEGRTGTQKSFQRI